MKGPRPEWRNGRRSGLKIHRGQPRASSTLASGIVHPQRLRCSSSGHAAWHFTAILPLVVPPKCLHVGSSYPDNAGGQEAICELFSGERSWSYGPRSLLVNSEQSSVVGWVPRRSRQFQHRISEIPLVHDCISTEYWVKHLCFLLAKCRLHPPPINDSRC